VQIPACLWFFNKGKSSWKNDRKGQVLFIDARKMGTPVSKTQIEFSDEEIQTLAGTFNQWANGNYEDVDWYCRSVSIEEIASKNYVLSPGRYINTGDLDEDLRANAEVLDDLTSKLSEQMQVSSEISSRIAVALKAFGYEV
jgi:type I restriction enzyme M protein